MSNKEPAAQQAPATARSGGASRPSGLDARPVVAAAPLQAEKPVLAWDGDQWVRAMWVPRHTKEQNSDSDWYDYSEEHDTFYWPEGWYELQSHGGDEMLWHITNGATEWQELPPPLPVNATEVPSTQKELRRVEGDNK